MTRQQLLNHRLAQYLDAETQILSGAQSYTIGDRTLTRASLKQIRDMIESLIEQGAVLDGMEVEKKSYVKRVIFDDR